MSKPRVLLADDHALVVEAFASLLSAECEVVGKVTDGRALIAEAERLVPDIIVLDITMPLLNGLEAARHIKQSLRQVKLVFVTMNEEPELAAEAFRIGASAYLLKRSAPFELITAIQEVAQGRAYVTPLVAAELMGSLMEPRAHGAANDLTPRQREILQLLAEGRSMKEVGAILNVTRRTVAFHKYRMMQQLKLRTTAELVQYAVRQHIV